MGVDFAIVRAAANTGGGNQTFTASEEIGTPKIAIFFWTSATADATAADHLMFGIGACDDSAEWNCHVFSQHDEASTNVARTGNNAKCIEMYDGSLQGAADWVSFGDKSVTVKWSTTPASGWLITCLLISGSDLSVDVHTFDPDTTENETEPCTAPGFEPDVLIFAGVGYSSYGSAGDAAVFSLGFAVNDDNETQRQLMWCEPDGAARGWAAARVETDSCCGQLHDGSLYWTGDITSFDANGYTMTTKDGGTSSDHVFCVALKFNGTKQVYAGTIDSPTSTGSDAQTGVGFRPDLLLMLPSMLQSIDVTDTEVEGDVLAAAVMDGSTQNCLAAASESAADPTDTQSLVDDQAINVPQGTGSAGFVATLASLDPGGWTLKFTTTMGTACKWPVLAVGAPGSPSYSYAQQM